MSAPVVSMADVERYGPCAHRMSLREGIEGGVLSDYQVAVVAVTGDDVKAVPAQHSDLGVLEPDQRRHHPVESAVKQIALAKIRR